MRNFIFIIFCIVSFIGQSSIAQKLIKTNDATISFVSEAPLELIKASTSRCQGILDLEKGDFAFRISIRSFEGFNSPLQKVHFFENYMEVNEFPDATFVGKMVENVNLDNLKDIQFRAKGILEIHGVKVERIIPIHLSQDKTGLYFETDFLVPLEAHDIDIPTIVRQKIAEEIKVKVYGILE
jgi:hypothetical protein